MFKDLGKHNPNYIPIERKDRCLHRKENGGWISNKEINEKEIEHE